MGALARFRLFGIPVSIHPSVLVIVVFLGWASGFQRLQTMTVWAAVVFVSLLVHELGHALTARSMGSEVAIELNGFGGLTRWTAPTGGMTPGRTALVSAAGSASGFLFAGAAWVAGELWGPFGGLAGLATRVLFYVNVVWGLLNWLPVRPLDGGHLLLAFLARVAPKNTDRIARTIFIGTAAVAAAVAFRYRLVFAGLFAVWMLLSELGTAARPSAPLPAFGYDDEPDDEEPVPEGG